MTEFTTQWDSSYEATPTGGTDISLDWQVATKLKEAIRERMEVDHVFGDASSTDTEEGYHKAIHMKEQSAPSKVSGFGILYVDTSKRVRFVDADGNDAHLFHEDHAPTKSEVGLGNVSNDAQLKIASNLSDLDSAGDARSNLDIRSKSENDSRYARIEAGTKMIFYQASAPPGWTQDTSVSDRMLRVVDGNGGGTGGGWTITGLNVQGHELTESEIPSHDHDSGNLSTNSAGDHDHNIQVAEQGGDEPHNQSDGVAGIAGSPSGGSSSVDNNIVKNAGSHSHSVNSGRTGNTGGGGSHDHGIDHDGDWRPSYIDVIVATKD